MANNSDEITASPNEESKPVPKPPTARIIVEHRGSKSEGGVGSIGDMSPNKVPDTNSGGSILERISNILKNDD